MGMPVRSPNPLILLMAGSQQQSVLDVGDNADAHSVIHVTFETGSMRYKALEQGVFVGAGRFVLEDGDLKVEYRISRVCKGGGLAEKGQMSR